MDKSTDFGFNPVRKVLIALDLDPSAQKVAEDGYSIAKTMNAEITLLHVMADELFYTGMEYSPITGFIGFSITDFSSMIDSEGLFQASQYFLDKIRDHLHDGNIKIRVETGNFPEMIIKTAEDLKADLIVMGSHSRGWFDQKLMGSVTEKVLHHITIPLLIIPTRLNRGNGTR